MSQEMDMTLKTSSEKLLCFVHFGAIFSASAQNWRLKEKSTNEEEEGLFQYGFSELLGIFRETTEKALGKYQNN